VHPVALSFRGVAELYERGRPGYPDAALAWLVDALALAPGRVVADLGAGTGKLTRRLLESGARVIAVEPLAEMRAILAEAAPRAEIIAATAEETGLAAGSLDAVTVAQAFHWFRAEAALSELERVLRPEGALALVWNVRDPDDPLQSALSALLAPIRGSAPSEREQRWRDVLDVAQSLRPAEQASFAWEQAQTRSGLRERFGSVSFVAALPEPERERLLTRVAGLAAGLPEPFPFRYRTELAVYRRAR
jgi:ubiquinone/menaquinone biosynthesis C-methylase UbiE